jgi:hypothetical protein
VTAQAEVVVAGEIEERLRRGEGLEVDAGGGGERAEMAVAGGGHARQGLQEAVAPGGGFSSGCRVLRRWEAVGLGGGRGQEVPGVGTGAVWDGGGERSLLQSLKSVLHARGMGEDGGHPFGNCFSPVRCTRCGGSGSFMLLSA